MELISFSIQIFLFTLFPFLFRNFPLQTHWHSFFVLADVRASMILGASGTNPLNKPPLVPTVLALPRHNGDVFK